VISVLGVHGGRVPPGTEPLLEAATCVAGGDEVLAALAPPKARQLRIGADLTAVLDVLEACEADGCVLASGDPGFFGIVRALTERLGPDRLSIHPAPSSVAVAFARLGLPWDDAVVVSAHGREPRAALHAALRHPKVAILTQPGAGPEWFAPRLAGTGARLVVAERLGYPDERLIEASPEELGAQSFAQPNLLLVLHRHDANGRRQSWPARPPASWALPEEAFSHRAGMITKSEIRALALARLGPGLGDLIWDIGCGSGSVAVECSRLGAAAIAVDHDQDAIDRTRANAERHAVPVRTVHGAAPAALAELPDPDAVFIGGGGEQLEAIIEAACARGPRAVVVTLALLERVGPALAALERGGLQAEATMLSCARVKPLAGGHRLAAENPVFVLSGARS
jgi:precorrin-6Y C5,15-methyltransferase (decarboxylating)